VLVSPLVCLLFSLEALPKDKNVEKDIQAMTAFSYINHKLPNMLVLKIRSKLEVRKTKLEKGMVQMYKSVGCKKW